MSELVAFAGEVPHKALDRMSIFERPDIVALRDEAVRRIEAEPQRAWRIVDVVLGQTLSERTIVSGGILIFRPVLTDCSGFPVL